MKTVLIIEDNPDNMLLISDILEMNECCLIKAETGFQGLAMAQQQHPDFIILDIQLPDINGYEVLDRLRADPNTAAIPVIAMTSFAMAGDREKLIAAGCDGYVEKPFDPAKVMQQIEDTLDNWAKGRSGEGR